MTPEARIAELEAALRVVSMGLLVIHSKRLDHFLNWTTDTDNVLDRLRETVRVALAQPGTLLGDKVQP